MVGIVRNAEITFKNEKEFKEFKNKIANPVPRVSIKKLQKEVEADGIVIQRGKEKHESK